MDRAATSADATAGCRIVGIRALVKLPVKGRWRSSCYELDILGTSPFWNHDCIGLPDRGKLGRLSRNADDEFPPTRGHPHQDRSTSC
jgi:hypothetical protein